MDYIDKVAKIWANQKEHKERVIGRYNSSELSSIIDYHLSPAEWFNSRPKDLRGANNISWGMNTEEMLNKWLLAGDRKYTAQVKDVYKIDGIEIVCVSDFDFGDHILECKCPECPIEEIAGIKNSNIYQLEIQSRLFKKPIYVVYMGRKDHKIFKYKQSDEVLKKIEDGLKEFHKKILDYQSNNHKTS